MTEYGPYPVLTAQEVATSIKHGQTVSFSEFSPAGAAKAVPEALIGHPFQIRVLTGASSGQSVDEDLAQPKLGAPHIRRDRR